MFTFLLTDLGYLFVHGITAANWSYNSLKGLVKVDVTVLPVIFYNTY